MMNKKTHSLATLYWDMPTAKLERRLAHADLAEVARSVATEELLRRQQAPQCWRVQSRAVCSLEPAVSTRDKTSRVGRPRY